MKTSDQQFMFGQAVYIDDSSAKYYGEIGNVKEIFSNNTVGVRFAGPPAKYIILESSQVRRMPYEKPESDRGPL